MTDPVAVYTKDTNYQEVKVIEEVVDSDIGLEGTAIVVHGDCPIIGYIYISDIWWLNMDITKEIASVGDQKAVQDSANWIYE